jgi:catalase
MSDDDADPPRRAAPPLAPAARLARFGLIGVVLMCAAGAFAYTGEWVAPRHLTQDDMMTAFQRVDGNHPGFRRNHAKGICVSGMFESSGLAVPISRAAVFRPGSIRVIGRFALAGDLPYQADKPDTVRSMALRFLPPSGQEWRTGMNNIPVFAVNSARGFYDQLLASAPDPATGQPDPAKMKAFFAAHPESMRAAAIIGQRPVAAGFAQSVFNSLNTFRFVNAAGHSVPVRWSMVPLQPFTPASPAQAEAGDTNYLFDDVAAEIEQHPLQWRLMVTVAQPGDPTDDATLPWPADRQQIDAGILTLDQVTSENDGPCANVVFDPLVLPDGIAPSDDPLLSARSAAYARSFTLRAGEAYEKPPSAVSAPDLPTRSKS